MTWQELTTVEPELLALEADLQSIRDEGGAAFCANAVWSGYGSSKGKGFKARVLALVDYGEGSDEAARHLSAQLPGRSQLSLCLMKERQYENHHPRSL
jgi:hypothetical protein